MKEMQLRVNQVQFIYADMNPIYAIALLRALFGFGMTKPTGAIMQ